MTAPGFNPDIVRHATLEQRNAADPDYCVFVEANAGSGKTRVLVDRVARLLLAGARPDRILCVTFTKAAAGEMQTRLFRKLGEWSTLADDALSAELDKLDPGTRQDPERLAQARRLFARALETPGGLKIQTLHAYCERLLRQFPLEAGVPPGFDTQDDAEAARARTSCLTGLLAQAASMPNGPVATAIGVLLDAIGPSVLDTLTGFATANRHELMRALQAAGSLEALLDEASLALKVKPELTERQAKADAWLETDIGALEAAASALATSEAKTDRDSHGRLQHALEQGRQHPVLGYDAYAEFMLTQSGTIRKQFFTKKLGQTYAMLRTLYGEEGSEIHRFECEILQRVRAARANGVSRAALRLAITFLGLYEARLHASRRVDFSDLVEQARALLNDAEARDWALYKLDRGLEHVLVDEAQDTAPGQWAVVAALTEEFFAGEGTTMHEVVRTVFCVGDEKQSIYSFQGADPRHFVEERLRLQARSEAAGLKFREPPLTVSFRSSMEVLEAVDLAFETEEAMLSAAERQGESAALERKFLRNDPETGKPRDPLAFHRYAGHHAARIHTPGCVEIWPPVPRPQTPEQETLELEPVDASRPDSARNQLAQAVAQEIADILARGDRVWEEDQPHWRPRPAGPGDILILVRKRGGLFEEIIRCLKLRNVPVAGADRMTLSDQLVVEDLLSLAHFALLPEDDLSLAEVLKSPFFHPVGQPHLIDDDALFDLSRGHQRRLWDKLRASRDPRFAEAREALDRARARVDSDAPYAFFASFLGETTPTGETRLARLYARLGEEARDPADELLTRALMHEREGAPSLARFVAELEASRSEIKREMEGARGEVRVMTVHGAKGLEAPIVFLPDTTQIPQNRTGGLFVHERAGLLWAPEAKEAPCLITSLQEEAKDRLDAEYVRLLYVALTRARDRLVVCGHTHGRNGRIDPGSWLDRLAHSWAGPAWRPVDTALDAIAARNGWTAPKALRMGETPPALGRAQGPDLTAHTLPVWAQQPAPEEPRTPRAIAPSRLIEPDEAGSYAPPSLSPLADGGAARFRRGELIHKLLQTLPDLPAGRRRDSASRYLAAQTDLRPEQREEILTETLGVLDDPRFAALFGPGSRAEVAITGKAPGMPDGVTVNGQIDRLVITANEILVIDYKTNRPPPTDPDDVPMVYLGQMAAYRALLQALHPDRPVRCALLWTDGPRLMELPAALLERALSRVRGATGA